MTKSSAYGGLRLADHGFGPLLKLVELTCLDVGARGGFTQDLQPISPAVRAIGFEPDVKECQRLNRMADEQVQPWRELRFLPLALGKARETRSLNLYRQRGCSSLLEANAGLARLYGRDDYYVFDGKIDTATTTADEAAQEYGFEDAAFFKMDVQGAELEILCGSQRLLRDSLVGLRVEVSFMPIYRNQPLFADIDRFLRHHHFFPMRFLELHPWRRGSKTKLPKLADGPFPYSEGQMIHGDVLYLKHPESMVEDSEGDIEKLIRAALIAITYGFIDHAMAIFARPAVNGMLKARFCIDPTAATSSVSRALARNYSATTGSLLRRRLRRLARL